MDTQGRNNLQGSYSVYGNFWEAPGIPVGDRSGLDGEHRDYLDDQLSRMLENEGNPHRGQDLSNSHRVINGDEPLPGRDLFNFIFPSPDHIPNPQPPDHIPNPQELCDAAREHLPDYTFTRQEVCDALLENDIIEMNDLRLPPVVNEENLVDELIRIIDYSDSPQTQSTDLKLSIVRSSNSVSVVMKSPESDSLKTRSMDLKYSIVRASNSQSVVIKTPESGKTREIAISAAKLEKLLAHLIKIGSKRAIETNIGSIGSARGGITLSRITKLWNKLHSQPAIGVIS